ncbi:hypothetical protein C478_07372 [Natrinema thermotolerans DSM 11552]|nr:hypothetical protein C478_07372 [Natrinema thermotolerans DSM 11552]
MRQTTFDDINTGTDSTDIVDVLDELQRGDRILVNGETEIRVHKNGDYFGPIEIEAKHPGGARANIGVRDGEAWFDASQLRNFESQKHNMTRIREWEFIERGDGR